MMLPPASVTRRHQRPGALAEAVYSPCLRWRYALTLTWDVAASRLLMILLNPSTATEVQNDPTIARCEARARALNHGALRVVNLFAFRATDPAALRQQADPVGPQNDAVLQDSLSWADQVLCGWGLHGAYLGRGAQVADSLRAMGQTCWHLGLTKAGAPRHPLYVGYARLPQRWF